MFVCFILSSGVHLLHSLLSRPLLTCFPLLLAVFAEAKEKESIGKPEDYTNEPMVDTEGEKRLIVSMADCDDDISEQWLVSVA